MPYMGLEFASMMQAMSAGWKRWGIAALLLAAGAGLRVYFVLHHASFSGDSIVYADLANNILRHHIYGFTEAARIRPTLIRLPGYPIFLAACFWVFGSNNFMAVIWVQAVVSLLECCLLGVLASRVWGRRAGLFALALAALCPFTANYAAAPLTETCTMFCVTLSLFSLERWIATRRERSAWNAWLIPLSLALLAGILLRPDQVLLAVAVVLVVLWASRCADPLGGRLRRAAPAAAVVLAIVLPLLLWGARNWRVFHVFQPLAPRYANDPGEPVSYGFQRWYRTWAIDFKATVDVYWPYDGSPLFIGDLPPRAFDNTNQRAETEEIYSEYNRLDAANAQLDREFAALASDRIRAHPFRYAVAIPAAKVADMWLRPRTELMLLPIDWWNWRSHVWESVEALSYAGINLAYLSLAVVGLWRWRRQRWAGHRELAVAMVAFVLLRNALLWTVDNSEPRYTLECFPIVILLAGVALAQRRTAKA